MLHTARPLRGVAIYVDAAHAFDATQVRSDLRQRISYTETRMTQ